MKQAMIALCMMALLAAPALAAVKAPSPPPQSAWVGQANNAFAADLYARLAAEKGNLFFSPNSIETALAMTYAGARGKTADEMAKVLHLPAGKPGLHKAFGGLHQGPQRREGPRRQAARLPTLGRQRPVGPEGLPVPARLPARSSRTTTAPASRNWISSRTPRARARPSTPGSRRDPGQDQGPPAAPGHAIPMTRLVLTNAIYFKGNGRTSSRRRRPRTRRSTLRRRRRQGPDDEPDGAFRVHGDRGLPGGQPAVQRERVLDGGPPAEEGRRPGRSREDS